jgi:glycosyltransferase involved in cell wall biosynthesis
MTEHQHTKQEYPATSVVIPCYGCAGTISTVLEALLNQTIKPFEIIVVNDASPDALKEALAPFMQHIVYVEHDFNKGLAQSYNSGLEKAKAPYVFTLHADCILDPDYIERLLIHMESDKTLGAATGQYLFEHIERMAFSDRMFMILNRIPVETDRSDQSVRPIHFIEGKADIFRRDRIAQYGFFNTRLHLTGEDQELSARMRADGLKLIQDARCRFRVMFTDTSSSLEKILRKQRTYARGQAYIILAFGKRAFDQTSPNRLSRMWHRLSQLIYAITTLGLLVGGFTLHTMCFWLAALLTLARAVWYFAIGNPFSWKDRLCAACIGPIGDFYYLAGSVEGLFKKVVFKKT